jgi:hypothetical protein
MPSRPPRSPMPRIRTRTRPSTRRSSRWLTARRARRRRDSLTIRRSTRRSSKGWGMRHDGAWKGGVGVGRSVFYVFMTLHGFGSIKMRSGKCFWEKINARGCGLLFGGAVHQEALGTSERACHRRTCIHLFNHEAPDPPFWTYVNLL